jgi:hypothetical protein
MDEKSFSERIEVEGFDVGVASGTYPADGAALVGTALPGAHPLEK